MRRRGGRVLTGLATVLMIVVGPATAGAAASITVDRAPADLNLAPAPRDFWMMNGRGDIVGSAVMPDESIRFGEWPRYGPFVAFGTTGSTYLHGMNNRGHVIGDDERLPAGQFLWRDGQLTYLDAGEADVWVNDVNNRDVVAGDLSWPNRPGLQAFSWNEGVFTRLATPEGMSSYTLDVNDRGQVLGMLVNADWSSMHGAVWDRGRLTVIGSLDGPDTRVRAINNRGQVIGFAEGRPFLWDRGRMRDLLAGTGATSGWASMINDQGVVLGEADSRSVVWTSKGMRYLIPEGYQGEATRLNRRGDAAGGMLPEGVSDPRQRVLFRWRDGRMTYYGAPSGSVAALRGLDDSGRLIGVVDTDGVERWVGWAA